MDKKDKVLSHIQNNVNWFMTTSNSVEIIPYYNMSTSVLNRVNRSFDIDVKYEDVV